MPPWTDLIDQNGYPSRRRSLVGDAQFETALNKENKRNLLEEIRQQSRDSELELSEDELLLVDPGLLAVEEESGPDAQNAQNASAQAEKEDKEEATIVLSLKDNMLSLGAILKTIDVSHFFQCGKNDFIFIFSLAELQGGHNPHGDTPKS